MKTISREELGKWIDQGGDFVLLDPLPPDFYAAGHLPGAGNACVFAVGFPEQVRALGAEPGRTVVVYGENEHTLTARDTLDRLKDMGFEDVRVYEGGLDDWRGAGLPLEGAASEPRPPMYSDDITDAVLPLDPAQSTVYWSGRNKNSRHHGVISFKSGELAFSDGRPSGGFLVADMASMVNHNLADAYWNNLLVSHLSSKDFFEVEAYPEARLDVSEVGWEPEAPAGHPNARIFGEMTVKDAVNPVEFGALFERDDQGALVMTARLGLDRTRWNVRYGSGRFYDKLGFHLVHGLIGLEARVVCPVG
jgi:rhodanese-related sulfurtransferase